jgi:cysteine desulfurase
MELIYLDYNATAPIHPAVREKIRPYLEEAFGNASSLHAPGRKARVGIEEARALILKLLNDPRGELVFTSGGTEAGNLVLRGVMENSRAKGNHLIISAIEHSAVLQPAQALQREGYEVTFLPVDSVGRVDPEAVRQAITPKTVLISIMHANNEIGTIEPIEAIGAIAREKGILFHTDAVQSFGKIPVDLSRLPVDLLSISAHKLGGLKGTGALYLRRGLKLKPEIVGGPHEHNMRAGTENVVGIVSMGEAARVSVGELNDGAVAKIGILRDKLQKNLLSAVPDCVVNGDLNNRVPGTLHLSFLGCESESLLMALDMARIAVSAGSACSAGSMQPSHVLKAMGLPKERLQGAIRISLGWGTTPAQIDEALQRIPPVIAQMRKTAKA